MPKKVIVFDLDDGEDIVEALREVLQGRGLRYQKPRHTPSDYDDSNYNSCAASTFGWSSRNWDCGSTFRWSSRNWDCGSTLGYGGCGRGSC